MERNRRIAKAYARSPIIRMDNRCIGFNGDSIGLRGFENPFRDTETLQVHRNIGQGVVVAADEDGNILLQMLEPRRVIVVDLGSQTSTVCPADTLSRRQIIDSTHKIFDMRNFVSLLNSDLIRSSAGVQLLENSCFTAIVFAPCTVTDVLDAPVWVLVINVIAMEMLHRNLRLSTLTAVTAVAVLTRRAVGSLQALALDGQDDEEEEVFAGMGGRRSKSSKDRRNHAVKSGTLMLGAKDADMLDSLRQVPTPDYDSGSFTATITFSLSLIAASLAFSDNYTFVGQKSAGRTGGILNSVLRHLPLHTPTRNPHKTWRRRRQSGPIQDFDSDESCTHIYSSICESASSAGKRTKNRSTISKSLRFFLKRSK